MTSPELMQLLNVLEERVIPLTHDDIAWAFESPQTQKQITQWVHQYLSPATLLTKEELHLYVPAHQVRSLPRLDQSKVRAM